MPSLPAVMNELMSYTVTPIFVVPLLASVSPAPQAVRPSPSRPAEAMAPSFVVNLISWFSPVVVRIAVWDGYLRLLLAGDALVGDVAGLEVLLGQLGESGQEVRALGDDVFDRDVDVRLRDCRHDVD